MSQTFQIELSQCHLQELNREIALKIFTETKLIHNELARIKTKGGEPLEVNTEVMLVIHKIHGNVLIANEYESIRYENSTPYISQTAIRNILKKYEKELGINPVYSPEKNKHLDRMLETIRKNENGYMEQVKNNDYLDTIQNIFHYGLHDNVCCHDDHTCHMWMAFPFLELKPITNAQSLDEKWFGWKEPLWKSNPEKVLKELRELLQEIHK